jgi:hypothetical protein
MLWIPHSLENRLTGGGKVVSLTHRPRSAPHKHNSSASITHLLQDEQTPGPSGAGRFKKFIHLFEARTRDLLACSILPQPLCYHAPHFLKILNGNRGHAVALVVKELCYKLEGRGFDSWWGNQSFFPFNQLFQSYYGPGVDSASKRNGKSAVGE